MSAQLPLCGRLGLLLVLLAAPLATSGCEDSDCAGGEPATCGYDCPEKGLEGGSANISKIASLDQYFEAVLDLGAAARAAKALANREITAIAASLALPADATTSQIEAALGARIAAATATGITVSAAPATCTITAAEATLSASRCDVSVKDGPVLCDGSCAADPTSSDTCGAAAVTTCRGAAPAGACGGTCTGSCALAVAAPCEGRCEGECTGTCSVVDASGACRGACEGTCRGTCALAAGASCEGVCLGVCDSIANESGCDPSAETRCGATPGGLAPCARVCEGEVLVTGVVDGCSATTTARLAMVSACAAPAVQITYQVAAGVDPASRVDFEAWTRVFETRLAALFAAEAKISRLQKAAPPLAAAAREDGAVTAAAHQAEEGDLASTIGARCALAELPAAAGLIAAAEGDLENAAETIAGVRAAIGR